MRENRQLDLIAVQDTTFLRIGADEFRSVVENDPRVAFSLLKTVSGHLQSAAELMRDSGVQLPQGAIDNPALRYDEPQGAK